MKLNKLLINLLYILLILAIVAYAFTSNILIGIFAFFIIVLIFSSEITYSSKNIGVKKTMIEFALSIIAAILTIYGIGILLGTQVPIDTVASCSMLPHLNRGDLVIIQGIKNYSSFVSNNKIPTINMSPYLFSLFNESIENELVLYLPYYNDNKSNVSLNGVIIHNRYNVALYSLICISRLLGANDKNLGQCVIPKQIGIIRFNYTIENVSINGKMYKIVDNDELIYDNKVIKENYTMPIIVYRATPPDSFSGDIIHRVVAAIRVNDTYYFITKGDNNNAFDIQYYNKPPSENEVLGYMVYSIPLLGYVKLIVSGQLAQPLGCNQSIIT